jgi:hypothetical protein
MTLPLDAVLLGQKTSNLIEENSSDLLPGERRAPVAQRSKANRLGDQIPALRQLGSPLVIEENEAPAPFVRGKRVADELIVLEPSIPPSKGPRLKHLVEVDVLENVPLGGSLKVSLGQLGLDGEFGRERHVDLGPTVSSRRPTLAGPRELYDLAERFAGVAAEAMQAAPPNLALASSALKQAFDAHLELTDHFEGRPIPEDGFRVTLVCRSGRSARGTRGPSSSETMNQVEQRISVCLRCSSSRCDRAPLGESFDTCPLCGRPTLKLAVVVPASLLNDQAQ